MISFDLIDNLKVPHNEAIFNSFLICDKHLKDRYSQDGNLKKIFVSISGGSDSDIVLDLIYQVCKLNDFDIKEITFGMVDTGCEYMATRNHIKVLEEKYKIKIEVLKPVKPIPLVCRDYGQPFLSKQVSEFISRLQRHNFKWEDRPFNELLEEYPKCKSALKWWCDIRGDKSKFGISRNKWLKEFMIENPPTFKISNVCCLYAKKKPLKNFMNSKDFKLDIMGVRKSEGGARSSAYKNCFTDGTEKGTISNYRPIFYYKDNDKRTYQDFYNIDYSECYRIYGLKRTGCAGCPYNKYFNEELEVIKTFEPKLYNWCKAVYKDSYEYTNKYREFCEKMNKKEVKRN